MRETPGKMSEKQTGSRAPGDPLLEPTRFIDCDSREIMSFAREAAGAGTAEDRAVAAFYTVRDSVEYDLQRIDLCPERFRASSVLARGSGFCVEKAVLLAAVARALGIPSRLHFADVRNHLTPARLLARIGTDLFVFHGYVEMMLGGRWVKATPAFDASTCRSIGARTVEFDGKEDALLHERALDGRLHIEYVDDRGSFADLPYDEMASVFERTYPLLWKTGRAT